MNTSFRIRFAVRNQHLTGARFEDTTGVLAKFVRRPGYQHQIVLRASEIEWLGWTYDADLDLIVPHQKAYEWLTIFPEERFEGAWDTCLSPREVDVYRASAGNGAGGNVSHTLYDLVVSFENEEAAMLFMLTFSGGSRV